MTQATALVDAQRQSGSLHPAGSGNYSAKQRVLPAGRADLFLHVTHLERQVSRADANRANVIAGQTIQAGIHLFGQVGGQL